VVRTAPARDVSILLDFGRIMTAGRSSRSRPAAARSSRSPAPRACPASGARAALRPTPASSPSPAGVRRPPLPLPSPKAGVQTFERFEWCAIRWVQLTIRNAPEGLVIRGFRANLANYPVEERGRFQSSDDSPQPALGHRRYTFAPMHARRLGGLSQPRTAQWLGDVTVENLVGHRAFRAVRRDR